MDQLAAGMKAVAATNNNNNNNDDGAVVTDDLGGGDGTYCPKHPYRTNLGGGICAFCLQEKLSKLVSSSSSSSFPLPVRPSPSSPNSDSSSPAASSPPSSDLSSSASSKPPNLDPNRYNHSRNHARRGKIPGFLYSKKKKNKKCTPSAASSDRAAEVAFNRSNTAPRRPGHLGGFLDGDHGDVLEYSPRKKGFWSFLYLSGSSQPSSSTAASKHHNGSPITSAALSSSSSVVVPGRRAERMTPFSDGSKRCADVIPEDDDVNCSNGNNFERKVSRSRSVGCGSRSFSGDFFERISTGFGDCTLRRVESQREPNGHGHHLGHSKHRASSADPEYCMKERVRCGRIFGGFMMASSSSSLSSSSYWITTSSNEDHRHRGANRVRSAVPAADVLHARNRSWGGWVFASPMRAFGRPSSKDVKSGKSCNATPNINAIPSLLTVGG